MTSDGQQFDGDNNTECPTTTMTDCDMRVNGFLRSECSVSCDNDFDLAILCKCGRWQEMRLEIAVPNDGCGGKCPA